MSCWYHCIIQLNSRTGFGERALSCNCCIYQCAVLNAMHQLTWGGWGCTLAGTCIGAYSYFENDECWDDVRVVVPLMLAAIASAGTATTIALRCAWCAIGTSLSALFGMGCAFALTTVLLVTANHVACYSPSVAATVGVCTCALVAIILFGTSLYRAASTH